MHVPLGRRGVGLRGPMLGELGARLLAQKRRRARSLRSQSPEHLPAAKASPSRPRRRRLRLGKGGRGGVWRPPQGPGDDGCRNTLVLPTAPPTRL
ncbi:hypothetical protein PR202_ga26758 [Eleusine coracana subsp. coracana]|uniref:Uncharacterized protein n=1 Tax=Eleusine coracana subsp. coracana TaxID=191504 RepID=A0AAV5DFB3_ELECO|nr:hypothetical protein PR202_ga26758 [Eleusine coracana subsp. coracana]